MTLCKYILNIQTYTITLYVNGIMNNRVNNIRNFEPSINFSNRIYYQSLSGNEYVSCDYTKGWEYEICEYPESYHRKKAWNNFWLLMYWSGEDGKFQNYKMNKKQKQLFEKRVQVYNSGVFDYYFSTTNNIADAVIDNFFSKRTEVIKYPPMFEEDFSHKYRIRIAENDQELLSLWIYFCMEQMVVEPCVCGIYVGTLINGFRNENPINEEINEIVRLIKRHLTNNYTKIVHSLMEIYPYETLLSANGNSFKYENDIIKKMYSYVCANREVLQEKYSAILLELAQCGKISSRWKSEFNLFILTKSYFPNAIYQYRSDWLQGQSLDIYIPELKLGIEYQGIQHYEAVDLFGGEEGLKETQKRDAIKKKKCKENRVRLCEWHYTKEIKDWNFVKMLKDLNYKVPMKQNVNYQFIVEESEKEDKVVGEVICQYDLQGKLLGQYDTISEAAEKCNIKEYMIRRACSGIRNSAGNYQWRKVAKDCVEIQISALKQACSEGKARRVAQISEEGEVIVVYNSIAEAVRLTGVNSKSIRDAATGKQKHAGGFKWKYQD